MGLHCIMWDLSLWLQSIWASVVPTRGLLSCSMACGILVPRPEFKSTSPVLQGELLTMGPAGKSL